MFCFYLQKKKKSTIVSDSPPAGFFLESLECFSSRLQGRFSEPTTIASSQSLSLSSFFSLATVNLFLLLFLFISTSVQFLYLFLSTKSAVRHELAASFVVHYVDPFDGHRDTPCFASSAALRLSSSSADLPAKSSLSAHHRCSHRSSSHLLVSLRHQSASDDHHVRIHHHNNPPVYPIPQTRRAPDCSRAFVLHPGHNGFRPERIQRRGHSDPEW